MTDIDLKKDIWQHSDFERFDEFLKSLADEKFSQFSKRIVCTPSEVLGIRVPKLREIARNISKGNFISFLEGVKVDNLEKSMIFGLLTAKIKDEEIAISFFKKLLPLIDNWATCDICCGELKIIGKNPQQHWDFVTGLLNTGQEFVVRVGVILLMDFYKLPDFVDKVFALMDEIDSTAYYVNMAQAWLVAEFFLFDSKRTEAFLQNNKLNKFTHNKAIQKIRESFRVSLEDKQRLALLKR